MASRGRVGGQCRFGSRGQDRRPFTHRCLWRACLRPGNSSDMSSSSRDRAQERRGKVQEAWSSCRLLLTYLPYMLQMIFSRQEISTGVRNLPRSTMLTYSAVNPWLLYGTGPNGSALHVHSQPNICIEKLQHHVGNRLPASNAQHESDGRPLPSARRHSAPRSHMFHSHYVLQVI